MNTKGKGKRKLQRPEEEEYSSDDEYHFIPSRKIKKPKCHNFNQQFIDSDEEQDYVNSDSVSSSNNTDLESENSSSSDEDTSNLEDINLSDIRRFCKKSFQKLKEDMKMSVGSRLKKKLLKCHFELDEFLEIEKNRVKCDFCGLHNRKSNQTIVIDNENYTIGNDCYDKFKHFTERYQFIEKLDVDFCETIEDIKLAEKDYPKLQNDIRRKYKNGFNFD
tara:strand:+ start:266 stop:922 length:657 start_codon:yes stop_codon:yes gene_type:complete